MKTEFPNELIQQYINNFSKLKKFQRVVFKRFGPNVSEISEEFNLLALNFDNSFLSPYAGICWWENAKCEKALGNTLTETEALLKSARAFVKSDREINKLGIRSNNHENIEGALKCYNQASSLLDEDSVMKAAIIREIKKINPNYNTSNFNSPSHRIYDLEESAVNESIKSRDFVSALEKLTEIYDDITERNVEDFYEEVLIRNEISRIILLLILKLPPSRQSPSNIKLLEKYYLVEESSPRRSGQRNNDFLPENLSILFKELIFSCEIHDLSSISEARNEIVQFDCITHDQQELLDCLIKQNSI